MIAPNNIQRPFLCDSCINRVTVTNVDPDSYEEDSVENTYNSSCSVIKDASGANMELGTAVWNMQYGEVKNLSEYASGIVNCTEYIQTKVISLLNPVYDPIGSTMTFDTVTLFGVAGDTIRIRDASDNSLIATIPWVANDTPQSTGGIGVAIVDGVHQYYCSLVSGLVSYMSNRISITTKQTITIVRVTYEELNPLEVRIYYTVGGTSGGENASFYVDTIVPPIVTVLLVPNDPLGTFSVAVAGAIVLAPGSEAIFTALLTPSLIQGGPMYVDIP